VPEFKLGSLSLSPEFFCVVGVFRGQSYRLVDFISCNACVSWEKGLGLNMRLMRFFAAK
jgi:hypothetical protein